MRRTLDADLWPPTVLIHVLKCLNNPTFKLFLLPGITQPWFLFANLHLSVSLRDPHSTYAYLSFKTYSVALEQPVRLNIHVLHMHPYDHIQIIHMYTHEYRHTRR